MIRRAVAVLAVLAIALGGAPATAGWSGFARVGSADDIGVLPSLVPTPDGALHAFAVGADGGIYAARRAPGSSGSWSGFSRVGADGDVIGVETLPSVTATADGTLHVVVTGVDLGLYHNRRPLGSSWLGWTRIGSEGDVGFDPHLAADGNALRATVQGVDDGVYVASYAGSWTRWGRVGNGTGFNFRLAAPPGGSANLVVSGLDAAPWGAPASAGPTGWTRIGGPDARLALLPALGALSDGRTLMVTTGVDDGVYAALRSAGAGGSWSGFARVGDPGSRGFDPSLATRGNRAALVVTGVDGGIYANSFDGTWRGWERVGRPADVGQPPVVGWTTDGVLVVLVVGSDFGLYAAVRS